jgi:hypothetical protein
MGPLSFLIPEVEELCLGIKPSGTEEGHPHNVASRYVVLFVFVSFYDALHVWGRREMQTRFWFRNSKERSVFQDLGVGGSVILKK